MSEEEQEFSSGDEAVHAFLNELHEYKIRSTEKQKNQAEKFSNSSKKIKIKKQRESLFKGAAKRKQYVTEEEPIPVHKCSLTRKERKLAQRHLYNPDDELQAKSRRHESDWGRPKKWPLLSQRAYHKLILSEKEQESRDRLFNASKEAHERKEAAEKAAKQREQELICEDQKPKANPHSVRIAQERFHSTIEAAFQEYPESIETEKFKQILSNLGVSPNHKRTNAFISSLTSNGDTSESVDAATVKTVLLEAIDGVNRTQFHAFARQSMICHSASAKKEPAPIDEPKSPTKRMTPETLDRLCDLRPRKKDEEEEPEPPSPKKPPARKWHDPEPVKRTPEEQELHDMSIEERERVLIERKETKLQKLRELIASEQHKRLPRPVMPEYSEQTKQDIESWKKKREEEERLSQPTWTPNVTKYEDYLKKKKELENAKKPHGWDESVARHRMAIEAGRKKRQRNTEL